MSEQTLQQVQAKLDRMDEKLSSILAEAQRILGKQERDQRSERPETCMNRGFSGPPGEKLQTTGRQGPKSERFLKSISGDT